MGTSKEAIMTTALDTQRKDAEIKTRTYPSVKAQATQIYANWGITLNDAINMFLTKSIEVGGLPFNLRAEAPAYADIAKMAYKAPINNQGVAVLPASWDDND
jgi:DNA-damage-inducible protein J